MFEKLRAYFETKMDLNDDQFRIIERTFTPRKMSKGEFLQREGEAAKYGAFVISGCLRSYKIDQKGKEHILQFAPENWWISEFESAMRGESAHYFIDAIADSEILVSDFESQRRLMDEVPAFGKSFLEGQQRRTAAKDHRIISSLSATAEERYLDFIKTYPSIAQVVPQHMVASYLGLTPETISRVRKQLTTKK